MEVLVNILMYQTALRVKSQLKNVTLMSDKVIKGDGTRY